MRYFELLPKLQYGDLTIRNIFNKYILDNPLEDRYLYTKTLREHETLESVAYDEYSDPELWWVLVIINDIRDVIFDLPVPDEALQAIARQMTLDSEGSLDLAVYGANYDDLQSENNDKRAIKVLKADFVNAFLADALKNKPE